MARLLTVKEVVSQASMEIGISQRPVSQAVGSLDQDIAQMVALLSSVADEVLDQEPYSTVLGDGNWILTAAGTTRAPDNDRLTDTPTADEDRVLFDGRLAVNGLKFKFLAAKGLEYGEAARDYSDRMNRVGARANAEVIDLDADWPVIQ